MTLRRQPHEPSSEDSNFPRAAKTVSGLVVRSDIPNRSSISATFTDYRILPGVREVSFSMFNSPPERTKRISLLAEQIQKSGEINPLIVAIDAEGPYILEGGHRFDALQILGVSSFPALIVFEE